MNPIKQFLFSLNITYFYTLHRKQLNKFLFNFNTAYVYTFVAGIFVTIAINLLTAGLLTQNPRVCVYRVYGAAFSLFISSISAFVVSVLLETARSEWQSAGRPKDEDVKREDYIETGVRIKLLWLFFVIILVGSTLSIFLLLV